MAAVPRQPQHPSREVVAYHTPRIEAPACAPPCLSQPWQLAAPLVFTSRLLPACHALAAMLCPSAEQQLDEACEHFLATQFGCKIDFCCEEVRARACARCAFAILSFVFGAVMCQGFLLHLPTRAAQHWQVMLSCSPTLAGAASRAEMGPCRGGAWRQRQRRPACSAAARGTQAAGCCLGLAPRLQGGFNSFCCLCCCLKLVKFGGGMPPVLR